MTVFGPAAFDEEEDTRRIMACAKVVERAGGAEFEVGYLNQDAETMYEAQWWASARWRGVKLSSGSEHHSPGEACDALVRRLIDGGQCRCGKVSSTNPAGAMGGDKLTLLGEKWTHEEQVAAGVCVWTREGDLWKPGCDAPPRKLTAEQRKRLRG